MKISTGKKNTPIKGVIYGPEGVGKSTLASQFPDPIFIDLEEGTNQIDVKRISTVEMIDPKTKKKTESRINSYKALIQALKEIEERPAVGKTIVIDTADMVESLIKARICGQKNVEKLDDIGYHKGYKFLADEIQSLLTMLSRFVREKNFNIIFLAHSRTRKWEVPEENGAFDKYELNLEKEVAPLFKQWADILLFLNYQINVVKTGDGFNKKYKATGGKRVIYTTHSPTWDAKNRFGLPEELPLEYNAIKPIFYGEIVPSLHVTEDDFALINEGDEPFVIQDEETDLKDTVKNSTADEIISRLAQSDLKESDAVEFIKSRKIEPVSGNGDRLADFDKRFLKKNVLDKWESFKAGLLKSKGDKV